MTKEEKLNKLDYEFNTLVSEVIDYHRSWFPYRLFKYGLGFMDTQCTKIDTVRLLISTVEVLDDK
jgi:hypothetical protein